MLPDGAQKYYLILFWISVSSFARYKAGLVTVSIYKHMFLKQGRLRCRKK
jgi:hypothetical protein